MRSRGQRCDHSAQSWLILQGPGGERMACEDCETLLAPETNGCWVSTGEPIPQRSQPEPAKPPSEEEFGKNRGAPFKWVRHGELTRSGDSSYRSKCPVCLEGLLLIPRLSSGALSKIDSCIRCGQRFVYEDAEINGEKVVCPIPETLEDAVEALDKVLHAEDKRVLLSDPAGYVPMHHGLGRHLRNTWGLWHDSPLARHLKTVHKVEHPDDMSRKIVEAYVKANIPGRFGIIREENDL